MNTEQARPEKRFHGLAVSPGIARGKIYVMRDDFEEIVRYHIQPVEIAG